MYAFYHCLITLFSFATAIHDLGWEGVQPRDGFRRGLAIETSTSGAQSSTTTASPTQAPNPFVVNSACSLLNAIITSCEVATPGFGYLGATDQASCLCNNGTSNFDGAAFTCASYLSSLNNPLYSTISTLDNFCTAENSGVGVGTPSLSTTTSSSESMTLLESSSGVATATVTLPNPTFSTSGTAAPTASPALPGLRVLTKRERIGISAGCGAAALLAGIAIYSAFATRRQYRAIKGDEKDFAGPLQNDGTTDGSWKDEKASKAIVEVRSGSLEIGSA